MSESESGTESRSRGKGSWPGAQIGPPWPGTVGERSRRAIIRRGSSHFLHARDLGALTIGTRARAKRKWKRLTRQPGIATRLGAKPNNPFSTPAGESKGAGAPFSAPVSLHGSRKARASVGAFEPEPSRSCPRLRASAQPDTQCKPPIPFDRPSQQWQRHQLGAIQPPCESERTREAPSSAT